MMKNRSKICFEEGVYTGQTNYKAMPHGIGKMESKDGSLYEGQWLNGKRHGSGFMKFSSGNYYEGQFFNGLKEGFGKFYYSQRQETYYGYWKSDKKHGQGEYYFQDGSSFRGKFRNDKRNGIGRKITSKLIYQGVWTEEQKNKEFYFLHRKTGKCSLVHYRMDKKVYIKNLTGDNARKIKLKFKYFKIANKQSTLKENKLEISKNVSNRSETRSNHRDFKVSANNTQLVSNLSNLNSNDNKYNQGFTDSQKILIQSKRNGNTMDSKISENLSLIPEESETMSYCQSDMSTKFLLFKNDLQSVCSNTSSRSKCVTASIENNTLKYNVVFLKKCLFENII